MENVYSEVFRLLEYLSDGQWRTMREIGERLGFSSSKTYRCVDSLRECGVELTKSGKRYRINFKSPFFQQMGANITFTDTEAEMVCRILATVDTSNTIALAAKDKLVRYYGLEAVASPEGQKEHEQKLNIINEAIVKKQMLMIKGYSSPHSQSKKDRIVEPFLVMNGGMDIRCHEISSNMNKTFKLSRMEKVELMDTPWIRESEHRKVYIDLFLFSGEKLNHLELRMGLLSHNVMLEEYPKSQRMFEQEDDTHWILRIDVASYLGIGRFVLGLYDDIEILEGEGFKEYLAKKIEDMKAKL